MKYGDWIRMAKKLEVIGLEQYAIVSGNAIPRTISESDKGLTWVTKKMIGAPFPRYDDSNVGATQTAIFAFTGAFYGNVPDGTFIGPLWCIFGKNRIAGFRYSDVKEAEDFFKKLYEKGVRRYVVFGHSRGGGAADSFSAKMLKVHSDVQLHFYGFDPVSVSIFKRSRTYQTPPENRTIYLPKTGLFSDYHNVIACLGGRYISPNDAIYYDGNHMDGFMAHWLGEEIAHKRIHFN